MNDKWRDQITLDIIVAMNTALVNLRLYPPTSSMIINTIERLHQTLQGFFAGAPSLVLGEADKVLLIGDQPLSRKDLERPPIAAFLEVILNFGIKSITIGSDVTREDLSAFLEILGEKPVTISREGGLVAVMAARQVGHILIDEKIYIAKDSKQQILARLDIDDEVVVRYLTGGEGAAGADLDIQQLQDLAKDPDWLENVFKQGLNQIMGKRDTLPIGQLSANMVRMLGILDKVIDRADQEKFVRMIAKSIADLDVDMIGCILSRPLDTIFDGRLFGEVVAAIDEAKFEQVAARMAGMKGGRDALGAGAGIGGVGVGAGGVGGAAGGVSAASPGAAGVMGGAAPGAGVGGPGTAAFGAIPPPSAAAAPGAAGAARYAAPASGAAAAPGYAAPSAAAPAPGFAAGAASGAAAASGFASRTPPSAAPQYAAPPSTTSPSTTSPSATPPSGASGVPGVSAVPPAVPEAYRRLMETEKGRQLRERAEAERLRAEDEKSRKLATLKEKISPLLQGREECFLDEALMCSMADIVGELAAQEGPETTDAVLDRLAEALRSDRQDVRDQAAAALAQILDRLPERRRQEELNRLADRLRAWIEKETVATTAYRKLCHLLKDLISLRIGDGEYREALPLLQLFHRIDYGLLEKNETAQEIAMDIIRGLSTPERLDFLFDRYERLTGEDEEQKDVGRLLALLCLVVPLASQMRPESGLIGLWAFLALLVTTPRRLTRWEVWLLGIPALVFILPQFLHIHAVSGESWGAEGAKFSLEFFFKNIAVNGPYYLNNQLFPAVFTFLAFLGLAGPLRNRGRRDEDGPASAVSAGNAVGTVTAAPSRPDEAAGTDRIDVSGSSDLSRSRGGGWVKIGDEKGKGGVGPAARGARFVLPGLFLLWFVMFWGIFLFFYAGSYKYGADVRFALVSFMPLAVLAGMGADRLQAVITRLTYRLAARRPHTARAAAGRMRSPAPDPEPFGSPPLSGDDAGRPFRAGGALAAGLIFVLLLYSWLPFLPLIRLVSQEAWGARYDHAYARQFIEKIPRRSVVLTHVPTMLLLWQQGAIQTFAGINNPDIITELLKRYNGHVYFHHNYWCSTAGHHKELCSMMREKYELTEIAAAQEQHVHYGLYRIRFKENPH